MDLDLDGKAEPIDRRDELYRNHPARQAAHQFTPCRRPCVPCRLAATACGARPRSADEEAVMNRKSIVGAMLLQMLDLILHPE